MNAKEVMQALLDGKKVRKSIWTIDSYIVLNSNELVNNAGKTVDWGICFNTDDWELYQEPKKKKRFWLWNVCRNEIWLRWDDFLDDHGVNTAKSSIFDWHELKKQKLENEFIDIDWEE